MELNATVGQFSTKFSRAEIFAINQIRWRRNGSNHTLAYAKAVAWSRHATGERVQRGNDTTGSVASMQFLFANNYSDKARESEFILDKLEGFFALH